MNLFAHHRLAVLILLFSLLFPLLFPLDYSDTFRFIRLLNSQHDQQGT